MASTTFDLGADPGRPARLRLLAFLHDSDAELPGALPRSAIDARPETASTPLDRDELTRFDLAGIFEQEPELDEGDLSHGSGFRAAMHLQVEDRTLVETIFDTQSEDRSSLVWGSQTSYRVGLPFPGVPARLLVGAEFALGRLDSEFRAVEESGLTGDVMSSGEIGRDEVAGYARVEVDVIDDVRVGVGIRRDDLWADLTPAPID